MRGCAHARISPRRESAESLGTRPFRLHFAIGLVLREMHGPITRICQM